jgi:hypothetical protein
MEKFLEKKRFNPKSRNPAENTKDYSKGGKKGKSKKQIHKEEYRKPEEVPAEPKGNKADAWLEQASRPRDRNKMSSENRYGEIEQPED